MLETVKTVEDSIQEVQRQKGKEERKKQKSQEKRERICDISLEIIVKMLY